MLNRSCASSFATLGLLLFGAVLGHAAARVSDSDSRPSPPAVPGHPFPEASPYAAPYERYCARCHGADASAAHPPPDLGAQPANFRHCSAASAEPVAEWIAAIRDGGPAVGRSSKMPAFGDKLTASEIEGLAHALRALWAESGWPNGNLNFPRPLTVEKAFPEDEVVVGAKLARGPGEDRMLRVEATVEKRFGKRSMVEVSMPGATSWGGAERRAEAGDLSLALKHVLFADRSGNAIFSGGVEVTLPTAPLASSLGHGTTLYEPFVLAGLQRGGTYLQAALSLELPARRSWIDRELGYGLYVGRDVSRSPRPWTIGAELTGENRSVAVVPQIRKAITTTGALAIGLGLHVPLTERQEEPLCAVAYISWDFQEPIRRTPR